MNTTLKLIKNIALGTAIFDINTMCTFIFGQKKIPNPENKYKWIK